MNETRIQQRISTSAWLFAVGVVMIFLGILISTLFSAVQLNPKIVITIGLLITGWGAGNLFKYRLMRQNPQETQQMLIHERDERTQMIRAQAGNTAFVFMIEVMCLALLIYSITRPENTQFDPLWVFLAAMIILPMAIYVYQLIHLDRKY